MNLVLLHMLSKITLVMLIILSSSCHETFSGKNNRMSQKCKFLTTDLNEKNLFLPDIYSHAINQEL